jgi:hypothetical protein
MTIALSHLQTSLNVGSSEKWLRIMAPLYKNSLKPSVAKLFTFLKVIRMLILALGIKDHFLINDGRVLHVQFMLQ